MPIFLGCNAGPPSMKGLPSQVAWPHWSTVHGVATLIHCPCAGLTFWNLEGKYPWIVWYSLFCQDVKLCWKPCFSGAIPQRYPRGCLPGSSPQSDPDKTLFYFYYRLFIDYFHWQPVVSKSYLALSSSWILLLLVSLLGPHLDAGSVPKD